MNRFLLVAAFATAYTHGSAQIQVDPALPHYSAAARVAGTITAAGDDDMEGLMRGWVAVFKAAHPEADVRLDVDSSATAPKALATGMDQISFVGRRMLEPEARMVAKAWGHPALPIVVSGGAYDDKEKTHAEMVWVNAENPIRGLTLAQLDAIFGEDRRRGSPRSVETWGDLGLTGEWADKPVHVLRYKGSVGAAQFFVDTVLKGGAWRKSASVVNNVRDIPPTLAADKYAIGTAGLGFIRGAKVRAVAIASADTGPCAEPTIENVANRTYPLGRVVYIYVNKEAGKPIDALIREFLRAVLSKEGQSAALADGYLPLSRDIATRELAKLD